MVEPLPHVPLQHITSQGGTAVQLGLSHVVATGVALSVFFWMLHYHLAQPYALIIVLASAAVAGLLCTLNLQYSFYLVELTLAQFARGLPVSDMSEDSWHTFFARRWPVGPIFLCLLETNRYIQQYEKHAMLTVDLREKALRQAGEVATQAERNRIARELHDSIKQQIFSISVSAAAAKALWQGDEWGDAREAVENIQRSAKDAQVEMQALLQQLRPAPLENASLVEALNVQAQALGIRTGAQVHIDIGEVPGNDRLLPGTQETIFRLIQETFANIAKHARASNVWLSLHAEDYALRITVRDDGQGFEQDTVRKGMGLNNLHERTRELHGHIALTSQSGQGTAVDISIPLLTALRSPEEKARQRYMLGRSCEQSKRGYQLSENASFVGMVLVGVSSLFNIHWILIALAVAVALYMYGSGIYYRIQVALSAGSESREALELRQMQYKSVVNLSRLLGLGVWYGLLQVGWLQSGRGWWLLIGVAAILIIVMHIERRRSYVDTERYYQMLSLRELRWDIERRSQSLVRSIVIWCIFICVSVVLDYRWFVLSPVTIEQQIAYGIALIFLLMGVSLFFRHMQLQRWRQTLGVREQSADVEERG